LPDEEEAERELNIFSQDEDEDESTPDAGDVVAAAGNSQEEFPEALPVKYGPVAAPAARAKHPLWDAGAGQLGPLPDEEEAERELNIFSQDEDEDESTPDAGDVVAAAGDSREESHEAFETEAHVSMQNESAKAAVSTAASSSEAEAPSAEYAEANRSQRGGRKASSSFWSGDKAAGSVGNASQHVAEKAGRAPGNSSQQRSMNASWAAGDAIHAPVSGAVSGAGNIAQPAVSSAVNGTDEVAQPEVSPAVSGGGNEAQPAVSPAVSGTDEVAQTEVSPAFSGTGDEAQPAVSPVVKDTSDLAEPAVSSAVNGTGDIAQPALSARVNRTGTARASVNASQESVAVEARASNQEKESTATATATATPALNHRHNLSRVVIDRSSSEEITAQRYANSSAHGASNSLPSDICTTFGSSYEGEKPVVVVGIGYQKCGTTMMSDVLSLHPQTVNFRAKEKHYLAGLQEASRRAQGLDSVSSYLGGSSDENESSLAEATGVSQCTRPGPPASLDQYFDDCFDGHRPQKGEATLDVTPSYGTIREIKRLIETLKSIDDGQVDFRFIATLREPVSRAVSATSMNRKINLGKYAGASDEDLDRMLLDQVVVRETQDEDAERPRAVSDGEYEEVLSLWLESFPKESLLVVNNAQLNNITTWRRIYKHIGLTIPSTSQITEWIDQTNEVYLSIQEEKYASSQTVPYVAKSDVQQRLAEHYQPLDAKLWQLLGVRWW